MSRSKQPGYQKVEVRWRDANVLNEQAGISETNTPHEDFIVETVGYRIRTTRKFVHVAHELVQRRATRQLTKIPHECILEIAELEQKERDPA